MRISEFKLERYFARHEFSAEYLLSSSDCDGLSLSDILQRANADDRRRWEDLTLGYTDSLGAPWLRDVILQHYNQSCIENVVIASPGELHFSLMNSLLNSGDHVVIAGPCYQSHYEVVKSIGCKIDMWYPDTDTWQFDVNVLRGLVSERTRLIVINFPHNPTGSYLDQSELDELVTIAARYNCYLYSDEMYHGLVSDGVPLLAPVADLYDRGISLWGTSKSFGAAGLRTGWLVAQDQAVLKKVSHFKDYLSICSSALSEVIAALLLNDSEFYLTHNNQKIQRNIGLFSDFSETHDFIKAFQLPRAGSTAFVELKIVDSALSFCDRLVQEAGIMALPAEMFNHRGKYIRVGFGRSNFGECLEALARYLDAQLNT